MNKAMTDHKRLLIIGGLPKKETRTEYGGATVLMDNFIGYLENHDVTYKLINTTKYFRTPGKSAGLRSKLFFFLQFLCLLPWSQTVMFNFSDHATVRFYPLLARLSKALGKKMVFRKFGGSLDVYLQKYDERTKARTFAAIRKADIVMLETKTTIDYVGRMTGRKDNIVWFPNVRNASCLRASERYEKRFVFISHILDEKGVGDILAVAETLPEEYTIELYGPIKEEKYFNFDWQAHRVTYGGVLTSEEVLPRLAGANLLLLPTSYREGYPGIIIEAMSVGVPALTTRVGGIPEIVESGKNGILVEAGNRDEIRNAILSVTQESYREMSQGALRRFAEYFESKATNHRILQEILKL